MGIPTKPMVRAPANEARVIPALTRLLRKINLTSPTRKPPIQTKGKTFLAVLKRIAKPVAAQPQQIALASMIHASVMFENYK
jgi:hypothetical protein